MSNTYAIWTFELVTASIGGKAWKYRHQRGGVRLCIGFIKESKQCQILSDFFEQFAQAIFVLNTNDQVYLILKSL